ncbi:hypothetical protein KQI65_06955 [bacterium]|nr:hypothetical protein [bacterium]
MMDVVELVDSIHSVKRQYDERQRELSAAFDRFCQGRTGLLPFDVTVGTDSTELTFNADYSSIADVKGIRYLHGSVGYALTYHAIRYNDIRFIRIDWPIRVTLRDGSSLHADGDMWELKYRDGALMAVVLTADSVITIDTADISCLSSGYEP